ncbi:MAG: class II fumarate hydratase [Deltaproteobacteria bacterium]|nr:class II fumarate hydratase [Deltaproteobacteria bacterium]
MMDYRIEADSMSRVRIPAIAYYGAHTQRAIENFPISGRRMPREFIQAIGIIKCAAAEANIALGILEREIGEAIIRAAREVAEGRFDTQFLVDVYQTGSGTSTNMNANEVIANRAIELLGGKIGTRTPVHPNDHVNRCQSSNDVIPSALHISALETIEKTLIPELTRLHEALHEKAKQFRRIVKVGRTHLQDAVPIRLGQEFGGYASQIEHGIRRLKSLRRHLSELALGGTAVGTGLNAPKEFGLLAIEKIAKFTDIPFVQAKNPIEANTARDASVEASGQLKTLAVSLMKIANDLRWMSSGPRCGLGEISLPVLQPGSSMMPGKVNPVIPESTMMVCATVIGHDTAITIGAQHGNLELNTMMPMIADHLLESIRLLANASKNLAEQCVKGIIANENHTRALVEKSLALVTSLVPKIGYDAAARIVKEAFSTDKTVLQVCIEQGILPKKEVKRLLNPALLTKHQPLKTQKNRAPFRD